MSQKNKRGRKLEISFDPKKRREFLSGFKKRKDERRKRAAEEFQHKLKAEYKKIREDVKAGMKNLKKTYEPLQTLTDADRAECITYRDNNAEVKIIDLAAFNVDNILPVPATVAEKHSKKCKTTEMKLNCIPGMEAEEMAEVEDSDETDGQTDSSNNILGEKLKSKKDLNRLLRKKTLKEINKSSTFKQKTQIERRQNRKKHAKLKLKNKVPMKKNKSKNKSDPRLYSKGHLKNRKTLKNKGRK